MKIEDWEYLVVTQHAPCGSWTPRPEWLPDDCRAMSGHVEGYFIVHVSRRRGLLCVTGWRMTLYPTEKAAEAEAAKLRREKKARFKRLKVKVKK